MEQVERNITNEEVFAKLCAVEALLVKQIKRESKGLWDVQDVADYCGLTYHHVYRNIVPDPSFPAPVDIQGRTNGKSKRLWVKEEVITFFAKNKKKKPRM